MVLGSEGERERWITSIIESKEGKSLIGIYKQVSNIYNIQYCIYVFVYV